MEHSLERTGSKSRGEKSILKKSALTEIMVIEKKTAKISEYICRWNVPKD